MHFGYIYEIKNDINGKTYVGKHECSEDNDCYQGSGILLKRAYKKYGIEHFTKRIIQYSPTEEDLNRSEKLWIDFYKGIGKAEYNIAEGGTGGDMLKYASKERKDEFRKKTSNFWKDRPKSEETKRRMRKHKSEEHKKHISEYSKHRSEEHRKHLSEARKNKSTGKHWFTNGIINTSDKECPEGFHKGRTVSDETRRKQSLARMRKEPSNKGKHRVLVDGKWTYKTNITREEK